MSPRASTEPFLRQPGSHEASGVGMEVDEHEANSATAFIEDR